MDESLKDRALGIFEKDQKQLEGAFEEQSDVKAVGIISTTTVEESDDGTYKKVVKEENAEDLYYDGAVVGKVENQIKEDAETLQAFCKEIDDQVIALNSQINTKKQLLVTLSTEAIGRNCWPGIAYSTTTSLGFIRQTDLDLVGTQNFGDDYSVFEDRVAMEIYKPMAGPDLNYGAENPFDPTSPVTLTSTNSGFGHENHRDNGRLNSGDDATEVEAGDYNVGGGGDGKPSPQTGGSGVANTGGGGGGASGDVNIVGGAGGSGVVILRYPSSSTLTAGAGLTQSSGSPFTEGSNKISVFTAGTGTISFS